MQAYRRHGGGMEAETRTLIKGGRWSRLEAKLGDLTPRQRLLTLLLISVLVYGGLILMDGLLLRSFIDQNFANSSDLSIFQERARLILNGGVIYRDVPYGSFPVESPPLINYLFLPPQLAGGEWWAYEIWFSLFALLSSLSTYLVLREWNDHLAFIAAALLLLSPFLIVDSTLGVQDEPIVAFLFIFPVLLFLRGNLKGATAGVILGFWTKFLSIILYPIMFIKLSDRKQRLRHIGLAAIISLVVALPFLAICPIEFLQFPTYYMLGDNDGGAGMSAVGLLSAVGIVVPGGVGALITTAALIASYWYCWRQKLDIWRSCLVVTVVFLCIYPMIRLSYFVIPFSFLVVWAAEDRRVLLRILGMYIPLSVAQALEFTINDGTVSAPFAWIGLAALLVGLAILVDATRIALRSDCFLDRPRAGAAPLLRTAPSMVTSGTATQDVK